MVCASASFAWAAVVWPCVHCALTLESPFASTQDVTPQITNQTLITASTPHHTVKSRKRTGTEILAAQLTVMSPSLSLSLTDCLTLCALCCTFHHSQASQIHTGWSVSCTFSGCFDSSAIRYLKATLNLWNWTKKVTRFSYSFFSAGQHRVHAHIDMNPLQFS